MNSDLPRGIRMNIRDPQLNSQNNINQNQFGGMINPGLV